MEDPHERHRIETERILEQKFRQGTLRSLSIPERLEGVSEVQSFNERVQVLRANSERSFNTILLYTFGEFQWRFTPSEIKALVYKSANPDDDVSIQGTNLYQEAKRLYIYLADSKVDKKKLTGILIQTLENLHPDEAEILKGMFCGTSPYKNITKNLVQAAFPDLFPEEVKIEEDPLAPEVQEAPKKKRGRPKKAGSPGSSAKLVQVFEES